MLAAVLTLLAIVAPLALCAQTYAFDVADKRVPAGQGIYYEKVVALNGDWEDAEQGVTFQAPFCTEDYDELFLRKDFFLSSSPSDTLYLYFGGIAWQAEIYLNKKLLRITEDPFEAYYIALPRELLLPQWNRLEVRLTLAGRHYALYPDKMTGIHKPAYVLRKAGTQRYAADFPELAPPRDSALVYAPYSETHGWNIEPETVRQEMRRVKALGIDAVYLPYATSAENYAVIAEEGVRLLPQAGPWLAFFKDYPVNNPGASVRFWHDPEGQPYENNIGVFSQSRALPGPRLVPQPEEKLQLTLLSLGLLVVLAVWKIVNGKTFERFFRPVIPGAAKRDGPQLRPATEISLLVARCALGAVSLSFVIFYLKLTRQLNLLNVINDQSVLFRFGDSTHALPWIAGQVFVALLAFLAARFFLLGALGVVYRRAGLAAQTLRAENSAQFPALLALGLLAFLLNALPLDYRPVLLAITLGAGAVYLAVKYGATAYSMKSALRMPYFLIILYISSLDILPWLLLL